MTQADLQKVLRAVDPAAVLVSPRIIERVIREDCRLPNLYWNIPHWKSYVCDRQLLFRHAEQALEASLFVPHQGDAQLDRHLAAVGAQSPGCCGA